MQGRNPGLIAIANGGTARSANGDDGNLNYAKGDLVSLAFDTTVDFSLEYRDFGVFARWTYFYDKAASDKDELGSMARAHLASYSRLLDVYAFGKLDFAGRSLFVRVGDQVVNWGESTFIRNGINVLNPLDVEKLRTPRAELKEALTPTPMLWLLQEVTDRLSVEATWMPRWDEHLPDTHVRLEPRGTFFSTDDFAVDDGKIFYSGFGRRNDQHGAAGVFPISQAGQLYVPRGSTREDKGSQYGVALRYLVPHANAEVSAYHVNYHSRTPLVSGVRGGLGVAVTNSGDLAPFEVAALEAAGIPATAAGDPACTAVDVAAFDRLQTPANIARLAPVVGGVAPATLLSARNASNAACATAAGRAGSAFVVYPKHIKLWGIGASAGLPGGLSLQGEYSYRGNQPLQLPAAEVLLAVAGSGNQLTGTSPDAASAVPYGTEVAGYRRVAMHQMSATVTKTFGPMLRASQVVAIAEVGYTHLDLPGNLRFAGPGCHLPQPGSDASSAYNSTSSGCFATRNSWGYRLAGRVDFDNVIDGGTITPHIAFAHDVSGVGPTFNAGVKAWTIGLKAAYLEKVASRHRLYRVLRRQDLLGHRRSQCVFRTTAAGPGRKLCERLESVARSRLPVDERQLCVLSPARARCRTAGGPRMRIHLVALVVALGCAAPVNAQERTPFGAEVRRQRGGNDTGVEGRPRAAGGRVPKRRTLSGSVPGRQAAVHDHLRERRAIPATALGRPDRVAAEASDVEDERLSDAAQRGIPAAGVRGNGGQCGHGEARAGRQRRRGHEGRHSVPGAARTASRRSGTRCCATAATPTRRGGARRRSRAAGRTRRSTSSTNSTSTTATSPSRRESAPTTGWTTCCNRSPDRQGSPGRCCWCTSPSIRRRSRAAHGPTTRHSGASASRQTSTTTIRARPRTACAPTTTSRCTTAPPIATTGSSWAGRSSTFPTTRTGFPAASRRPRTCCGRAMSIPTTHATSCTASGSWRRRSSRATSHVYGKRVFYIDEDSWMIAVTDKYDTRGELWRVAEQHSINCYDVPMLYGTVEVHNDLAVGALSRDGPAQRRSQVLHDLEARAGGLHAGRAARDGHAVSPNCCRTT